MVLGHFSKAEEFVALDLSFKSIFPVLLVLFYGLALRYPFEFRQSVIRDAVTRAGRLPVVYWFFPLAGALVATFFSGPLINLFNQTFGDQQPVVVTGQINDVSRIVKYPKYCLVRLSTATTFGREVALLYPFDACDTLRVSQIITKHMKRGSLGILYEE